MKSTKNYGLTWENLLEKSVKKYLDDNDITLLLGYTDSKINNCVNIINQGQLRLYQPSQLYY